MHTSVFSLFLATHPGMLHVGSVLTLRFNAILLDLTSIWPFDTKSGVILTQILITFVSFFSPNFWALTCVFGFRFLCALFVPRLPCLHQHRDEGIGTPELRLVFWLHLHRHRRKSCVLPPNLCIGITCSTFVTPFLSLCTYPIESGFSSVAKHCTSVHDRERVCVCA
jgi:hypothetical protein